MSKEEFDKKDEKELWKEYVKTRNPEIREYFVHKYLPLVKYAASKVAKSMPSTIDFEDLISNGYIGLLDAIDKYDPEKEVQFKTYATTRIQGAIFDELRRQDWIPRSQRQKAKELERAITEVEFQKGRSATDEEIAEYMGISVEELQDLLNEISWTTLVPLVDSSSKEEEGYMIAENIPSPESLNPDFIAEREAIKQQIIEAIKKLPDKEKKVIVLYYYEDLTLKEIGEILGVTESRVSQLHTKAIMRLRGRLSKMKHFL